VSALRPEVRAGWCAFNAGPEGREAHMYRDTVGLVTTGIGCLIDPVELAVPLPWQHGGGTPAGEAAIRAEWLIVKAMPAGRLARSYLAPGSLLLPDDAIDALALQRLEGIGATLAAFWPDFASFPWQAQQALCSLAYGVGASSEGHGLTGPEWPHLQAAVGRQDWAACALEGVLKGNERRNAANAALFREAAEA
jgi:hypothetical protein